MGKFPHDILHTKEWTPDKLKYKHDKQILNGSKDKFTKQDIKQHNYKGKE
jgi:hypothetical protein